MDGLLRQEMGFDGVVCTDDLTMGAISNTYGMGEAAVMAVEAGCDLLLVCHEADNLTAAGTPCSRRWTRAAFPWSGWMRVCTAFCP